MELKELTRYMSIEFLKNPIFLFLFLIGILGIIIVIIKKIKRLLKVFSDKTL